MSVRSSGREVRVGLMVVLALLGLVGLLGLAGGGPGYLSDRRQIEVDFRDGQGIRAGSQVRVAGIDSGRVVGVTLAEVDGMLRARVRIAVPADLATRLKEDARIAIESSLTGQCRVNILSTGKSSAPLSPGKVVLGVETSMFDPVLEQVGLGPVERSNISHTIGEIREAVDATAPRLKRALASVDEIITGLKETTEAVRPSIASAVGNVDEATKRIAAAAPKIEATLTQVHALTARLDAVLAENRPNVKDTLATVRDLSATIKGAVERDQAKVSKLLDHADGTMGRADLALYNVKQITGIGADMLAKNKIDIERTVANVKDITDWGVRLVQKIYANPFLLSPFYKPRPEDVRAEQAYDSAQVFSNGATKLHDAAKTLELIRSKPNSPQEAEELELIRRQIAEVEAGLKQMSQQFSEAMKPRTRK